MGHSTEYPPIAVFDERLKILRPVFSGERQTFTILPPMPSIDDKEDTSDQKKSTMEHPRLIFKR